MNMKEYMAEEYCEGSRYNSEDWAEDMIDGINLDCVEGGIQLSPEEYAKLKGCLMMFFEFLEDDARALEQELRESAMDWEDAKK